MQGIIIPCEQGGKPVITGGISSSTLVMQSYPSCTITVYINGGSTLATLYSNNSGTPLSNPFTANNLGFGQFYAADGRYDVQISGGGPPSLSSPYVFRDIILFDYSTFSVTPGGPSGAVQFNGSGSFSGSSALSWSGSVLSITGGITTSASPSLGLQSTTDGVSMPGYLILPNGTNTAGGYADFRPVTQSPTSGYTCYDAWGNIVAQPSYLPGIGAYGTYDTIFWNSTSPTQGYHAPWTTVGSANYYITGVPCAAPISTPAGEPNGLNTNTYIFALGGFATDNLAWDAVQLLGGGMQASQFSAAHLYAPGTQLSSSYTPIAGVTVDSSHRLSNPYGAYLGGYITTGYSDQNPGDPSGTCTSIAVCDNPLNPNGPNSILPGYASGAPVPGMMSFNTALNCEVVYNGTTWVCLGSGGGGGAVGPTGAVQLNGGSGSFTGSAALAYASNQLSVAGVVEAIGTTAGFNAPTDTEWNTIQAPLGGMYAHSLTALNYIQAGNYSSTLASGPPLSTGDTFHAGALSFYTGLSGACPVFYNGTTWQCFASSGTVSGGTATEVAFYTGSGASTTLGGNTYFYFTTTGGNPLLTVTAGSSSAAGMAVANGYMQADSGFLATPGTCNVATCLNAPTGGGTASSFTATKYLHMIQGSAPTPTSGETTALGILYFDSSGVLKYCSAASGTTCSTWTSLASGSTVGFGALTTGVNTTATMTVGSGGSIVSSSATAGVVSANQINGTSLASLGTGLVKNTTSTGVPSIAAYGDIVGLFSGGSGCTGTNVLAANGTCVAPGVSYWTLAGTGPYNLFPSSTAYRLSVGETTNNSGAALEVNGSITMLGNSTITAYTTAAPSTAIALQTQYYNGSTSTYNFSVDYLGDVSGEGFANFLGGYKVGGSTVVDSAGNMTTQNLTVHGTCTGCGVSSNWTLGGSNLYPNSTGYSVLVGETSNSSGAQLEVNGSISTQGTSSVVQCTATGTNLCFKSSTSNFEVNGNGVVSAASYVNAIGGYQVNGVTIIGSTGAVTTPLLDLSAITGSTQCLEVNTLGLVFGTGSPCGSGSSNWTLSGSNLYPNSTGYNVLIGETSNSSGALLEVNGSISTQGSSSTIQCTATGTNLCLKSGNSNFEVNGNGVVSAASYVNAIGGYQVNSVPVINTSQQFTGNGAVTPLVYTGGNTSDDGTGSALQQKVLTYSGAAGVFSGSVANYYDSSNRTANITTTYLYSKSGGTLPGGLYAACGYISGSQSGPPVYLYIVWEDELGLTYTQSITVSATTEPPWIIRLDGLHNPYIYTSSANGTTPFRVSVALVKLM